MRASCSPSTCARAIVKTIPAPDVHGVLAVPELNRVYASATNAHEAITLDGRTGAFLAHAPAGQYPDGAERVRPRAAPRRPAAPRRSLESCSFARERLFGLARGTGPRFPPSCACRTCRILRHPCAVSVRWPPARDPDSLVSQMSARPCQCARAVRRTTEGAPRFGER